MENDLLPSGTPPPSQELPSSRPPSNKKIHCEFCGCELTPAGDYLSLSDKAKELRTLDEANGKLRLDLASAREAYDELKSLLATVERERDTLKSDLTHARKIW